MSDRDDKFTRPAKQVLVLAEEEARRLNHSYIGTEHLLLALVQGGQGIAAAVLEGQGVKLDNLREAIGALADEGEPEQPEGGREEGRDVSDRPWGRGETFRAERGRFGKFTARAKKVLVLAEEEARDLNHRHIGTEHLLLGLVREGKGLGGEILGLSGVELDKVRSAIGYLLGRGDAPVTGDMNLTPRVKRVLELAVDESRLRQVNYVGTEHLLLGLLREGEGIAAGVLASLDVEVDQVRNAVQQHLGAEAIEEPASLRGRVEQSLRQFFSGPRENVLSIRVDNSDVAAIDSLVEAGVLKTRSEAAAWLIKSGIEANRSLFERVQTKTAEIRRLRQEAQELIHRHVEGEALGPVEPPEPSKQLEAPDENKEQSDDKA